MPRQAGVLLPLFSIRSSADWGVGEIPDLVPWARWCAAAGFSAAQVLPVNEASRGQNSPYAALSAFAIDPVYLASGALEDFDAAGGLSALPREDASLLEQVRASPTIRWNDVRALKQRAPERPRARARRVRPPGAGLARRLRALRRDPRRGARGPRLDRVAGAAAR